MRASPTPSARRPTRRSSRSPARRTTGSTRRRRTPRSRSPTASGPATTSRPSRPPGSPSSAAPSTWSRPARATGPSASPAYSGCRNFRSPPQPTDLQSFGGTSESAPLTAGVAALVIQAYRSTHGGASPTPAVVKQIITGTAHDLGLPADEQGAGLLDARASVEAALTYPGAGAAIAGVGSQLITSDDQLTLTGQPGATKSGKVTVTNVGPSNDQRRLPAAAGSRRQSSANQTVAVRLDHAADVHLLRRLDLGLQEGHLHRAGGRATAVRPDGVPGQRVRATSCG